MKIGIYVAAAAIAITSMSAAQAGDPEAAAQQAKTVCAGCHGPDGISTNPLWPNIAGQKEQYLIKAMQEYRAKSRPDPNMGAIAQSLTDRQIEDLAAYYSQL